MRAGVAGFQAERLTQAREARGLTKVALSQLLSSAASSVTRWEQGDQLPSPSQLENLGQILGVLPSWFLQQVPPYGDAPYFYRDLAATTKEARSIAMRRLQWVQDICMYLQQWVQWPEVNVPSVQVSDCRELSDADIESLALQCRTQWGLGLGPVSDVLLALENAGVVCARENIGYSKMDGLSHWLETDARPYVYLVSDKGNPVRSRFDAAHELGHLVLHRYLTNAEFDKRYKEIERQAHLFASAFLLPAESFAAEVSWPSLDTFVALKARWKVSIKAMVFRCRNLDIIGDDYSVRLYKNFSARGWNRGEPTDIDHDYEPIRLMPRAIELLLSERLVTREGLIRQLGLSAATVESLCSLPEGYLSERKGDVLWLERIKLKQREAPAGHSAEVLPFPGRG